MAVFKDQQKSELVFFCFFIFCALVVGGFSFYKVMQEKIVLKPINELSVRITSTIEIPDPANVQSSGDWYLLDHVSGGLAFFDSDTKKFSHLLTSKWSTKSDGTHWFKLNQNAKFHDRTPITTKEIGRAHV